MRLEKVTEKTFFPVVKMKISPEQEKFVAPNVMSLAQAWLYDDAAKPFAILDDNTVVGFMMLDWDEGERTVGIWRMMIGQAFQRKGYGRSALTEALNMIRETRKFDMVHLDYVPGNTVARDLYASLGFRENGEMEGDEMVMTLPLTDRPKVGITVADEDDMVELTELVRKEKARGTKIPSPMETREQLQEAVGKKQVRRLTLMGKTIGLALHGDILLSGEYPNVLEEAVERVKQI